MRGHPFFAAYPVTPFSKKGGNVRCAVMGSGNIKLPGNIISIVSIIKDSTGERIQRIISLRKRLPHAIP